MKQQHQRHHDVRLFAFVHRTLRHFLPYAMSFNARIDCDEADLMLELGRDVAAKALDELSMFLRHQSNPRQW